MELVGLLWRGNTGYSVPIKGEQTNIKHQNITTDRFVSYSNGI